MDGRVSLVWATPEAEAAKNIFIEQLPITSEALGWKNE